MHSIFTISSHKNTSDTTLGGADAEDFWWLFDIYSMLRFYNIAIFKQIYKLQ